MCQDHKAKSNPLCLTERDGEECFASHLHHTALQCSPGMGGIKNTGVESFSPTTHHTHPSPSPFFSSVIIPSLFFTFGLVFFLKGKGLQTVNTFLSCTSCSEQRLHSWSSSTRQPSGKQSISFSFQCPFSNRMHKIAVTPKPRLLNASAATCTLKQYKTIRNICYRIYFS